MQRPSLQPQTNGADLRPAFGQVTKTDHRSGPSGGVRSWRWSTTPPPTGDRAFSKRAKDLAKIRFFKNARELRAEIITKAEYSRRYQKLVTPLDQRSPELLDGRSGSNARNPTAKFTQLWRINWQRFVATCPRFRIASRTITQRTEASAKTRIKAKNTPAFCFVTATN